MLCRGPKAPLQWLLYGLAMLMKDKESGDGSLPARQPHRDAYGCVLGILHASKERRRTTRACRTRNHDFGFTSALQSLHRFPS